MSVNDIVKEQSISASSVLQFIGLKNLIFTLKIDICFWLDERSILYSFLISCDIDIQVL